MARRNNFRVRPIHAANGRIQGWAVEKRFQHHLWDEEAFYRDRERALTVAHWLASEVMYG